MNEKLSRIYVPTLKQMGAVVAHSEESKLFARFDNGVFNGAFYAVEVDENCLITHLDVQVLNNTVLRERQVEGLCIASFSDDCVQWVANRGCKLQPGRNIALYLNHDRIIEHNLERGGVYEFTSIFYLPEYFSNRKIASIASFSEMKRLVSNLDDCILAFRLNGIFDDLDFERAIRPSGYLYYRSRATEALVHIIDMVGEFSRLRRVGVEGEDFKLVRQVIEAVEENLAETPTIDELSKRLYVGHTHLCETFKRTTGLTIGQYARKRKIEFSQVLLKNPEIPIKEVARRMGYGSTESFSASFKRMTGSSPKSYRMAMSK